MIDKIDYNVFTSSNFISFQSLELKCYVQVMTIKVRALYGKHPNSKHV
jgi:hypothetical protein